MLKRAIIAGLPSAGNNVLDLRMVPIPVARYYTRAAKATGGVHVRLSPYDQRVVDIRFFGSDGLNLTREQERAVERVFFREDYRRSYMEDIGNIENVTDAVDVYGAGYLKAIDVQAIRAAVFRVVVDYAHAPAVEVLPLLLERLNVEVVPLNARIDANKISLSQEEFRGELGQLARIAGALHGISLGVRLDVGGEKIFVVDDAGANVPDPVLAAAMARLVFRSHPGSCIVVTTDQSCVFEKLAEVYGGTVRRCAVDPQALMQAADSGDVVMACDGTGHFVFPALHPAIDGLLAVGKLLELLAVQKTHLSEVIAGLPAFFTAAGKVDGDRETKGRVMRCLMQQFAKFRHEAMDGIKIYIDDCEWVLIRPDEDGAVFHLVAEAPTMEAAQEIIADYGGLVQNFVRAPCATPDATLNAGGVDPNQQESGSLSAQSLP
jgi:mannose-1-phosphate guanylyltransferase/phosphomannomutase